MTNQNIAVGVIVTLVALVGGYLIFNTGLSRSAFDLPGVLQNEERNYKTYSSEELGMSFSYPDNYFIEERTITEGERFRKVVVLIEDTPGNRQLLSGEVPSEGPVAITVDVFQNNLDNMSAEDFIVGTNFSNYKLGDGEIQEGFVSGIPAYRYEWDGLYRGESVVTATARFVYMFSATSLLPTDEIRMDFYDLLNTVRISSN
jgi:hypothetical protein